MIPESLKFHGHTLAFESGAKIMGILNITPDSFYDGGKFHELGKSKVVLEPIIKTAMQMQEEGADIVDIGGESTRPGARPLSAEDELERVIPVISALSQCLSIPISIDTYKSEVAEASFKAGATMLNDISGFHFDENMAGICAEYETPAILMHYKQKPQDMRWSYYDTSQYQNIISEISAFFERSLEKAEKVGLRQTILDVGFGFGKSVDDNYQLLNQLEAFAKFQKPLLVGLSRKSFIGAAISPQKENIIGPSGRLFGTIAANTMALLNGAHMLRVHDVKAAVDARSVVNASKTAAMLSTSEK